MVSGLVATFGGGVSGWYIWLKDNSGMVEGFVGEVKAATYETSHAKSI